MPQLKLGYLIFVLAVLIGLSNLIHFNLTANLGIPNSLDGSMAYEYNSSTCYIAIFGSAIGVFLLIFKIAGQWSAVAFWIVMITGIVTSLVCIVRCTDFLIDESGHYRDLLNYTTVREVEELPISQHMVTVTREHHCCGIINLLDWELIVYTLANSDAKNRKYIPDICCKDQEAGCGSQISLNILAKLRQPENISMLELENWNTKFAKQIIANIDIYNDTEAMGNLFGEEICGHHNEHVYASKEILFYREEFIWKNGTVSQFDCDIDNEECQIIRYLTVKTGTEFCLWKDNRTADYEYQKLFRAYDKDARIFSDGCEKYLVVYVNKICGIILMYNLALLTLFCAMMGVFHKYYWEYRIIEMDEYPQPRWYTQLANEKTPIHGFGDVTNIKDGRKCIVKKKTQPMNILAN